MLFRLTLGGPPLALPPFKALPADDCQRPPVPERPRAPGHGKAARGRRGERDDRGGALDAKRGDLDHPTRLAADNGVERGEVRPSTTGDPKPALRRTGSQQRRFGLNESTDFTFSINEPDAHILR